MQKIYPPSDKLYTTLPYLFLRVTLLPYLFVGNKIDDTLHSFGIKNENELSLSWNLWENCNRKFVAI